ncbi:MAG: LysM peptidoglycan-binding domain-containing protein [Anaerolineae bacterium]
MLPTTSLDRSKQDEDISETEDALHRQGLEHLQAGNWEAAVGNFSKLAEQYPEKELYASLLQQARLKARLSEKPPRRRKSQSALRSRRVWAILLVNLALWTVAFGQKLYEGQIVPSLQQRQAAMQRQKLLEEGRQLLIAGDFAQAEGRYVEVLASSPDNGAAQAALQEISRQQQLTQSYETALTLIEQEEWEPALAALEAIRQEDPSFRDVQDQIERVRKTRDQAMAFQKAYQLLESGDVEQATEQVLLLRETAPDYKPDAVNKLLVKSYMKQAQTAMSEVVQGTTRDIDQLQTAIGDLSEIVQGTTAEIEQLKQVLQLLAKALEIEPSDPEVMRENTLAQEYLAGLEAYRSGSWELASMHLANVYPMAPGYGSGHAAELLQAAYVGSGNRYHQKGDDSRAAEKYRQAIALGLAGDGRPMPHKAERLLQQADHLVRQGRYQEAVIVYGDILIIMNFPAAGSNSNGPTVDEPTRRELLSLRTSREEEISKKTNEAVVPEMQTPMQEEAVSDGPTTTPPVELYVVRPNDTLSDIARRYNTTVAALLRANDIIQNPNLIRPGWRLLIPPS